LTGPRRTPALEDPPPALDLTLGVVIAAALVGFAWWIIAAFNRSTGHDWDLALIGRLLWREDGPGVLLEGLWGTIAVSTVSIVCGMALGTVSGLASVSRLRSLRLLALGYVEIVRGTPLLVQIYVVYFFVASALGIGRFPAAVLAMTVFVGAYISEIVRAGVESVDVGQIEAARSLGLSPLATMTHIVLPQAFRTMVPPLTGTFMSQIKDSSLVSVISVTELTLVGKQQATGTFAYFEVWFATALLYLALTLPLSAMTRALERRMGARP